MLPPGARRRRPGRAHAAPARRARDPRDRPRLPRARGDDGPAHRAGQAQAARQPRPVPRPPRRPSCPTACTPCSPPSTSIFTEGHTATSGDDLMRVDLSDEAIRLGRVLVELMPDEPEAVGLLALMLLTEARRPARTAPDGSMVRLADQDRTRVGPRPDRRGPRARAGLPAPQPARPVPDPGGHRRRPRRRRDRRRPPTGRRSSPSTTSSSRAPPNPVVALNRAIAIGELDGPEAGLDALDALDAAALDGLPAVPRRPRRPPRPRRTPSRGRRRLRPGHRAHHQPDRAALPRRPAGRRGVAAGWRRAQSAVST